MTQAEIQTVGIVFAAIALILNTAFSYKRMKHDDASRSISASAALVREWREKDVQIALAFVENDLVKLYPDPKMVGYSKIGDDVHRRHVVRVSHLCDELSARTILGEADAHFVMLFLGLSIEKVERVLRPYLNVEREWRGEDLASSDPKYQGNMTVFAEKVRKVDILALVKRRHDAFLVRKLR